MSHQSDVEICENDTSQLEKPFRYSPLDTSVDGIRLILLEAGAKGEILKCTIKHVTFGQRPRYEALSYTWGDEAQKEAILLDGHKCLVTKNLHDALCCLRLPSESRHLWVDAICINQNDVPERNRQLSIMPFIYERARTVLIWLGLMGMDITQPSYFSRDIKVDYEEEEEFLKAICRNPYWNRLWIIQEVVKARRISVYIVEDQIDWEKLLPLLRGSASFYNSGVQRLDRQLANKYTDGYRLEYLLDNHRHALCKDPRDKVYGLIGLAIDWNGFPMDYRKTPYEVWKDTVHFLQNVPNGRPWPILPFAQLVKTCLGGKTMALPAELAQDLSLDVSRKRLESTSIDKHVSSESSPHIFRVPASAIGRILLTGPSYAQIINELSMTSKWRWLIQSNLPLSEQPDAQKESDLFLEALEELDEEDLTIVSSCHFECPWLSGTSVKDKNKCDCPGSSETTIDGITRSKCDCLGSIEKTMDVSGTMKCDEPSGKPSCGNLQPLSTVPTTDTTSPYRDGTCLYLLETFGKGAFGRIGLGPSNAQPGDWIYIIDGLKKVAVLRLSSDRMKLIGTGGLGPSTQHPRALHTDGRNVTRLFTEDYFSSLDCNDELHLFSSELFHLLD